jgi:hypothetical protein
MGSLVWDEVGRVRVGIVRKGYLILSLDYFDYKADYRNDRVTSHISFAIYTANLDYKDRPCVMQPEYLSITVYEI